MHKKRTASYTRILLTVLVVVMFFGSLSVPVSSDRNGKDALKITLGNVQTDYMELRAHEKIEIAAEGAGEAASYQWQILHPEKENLWVNIFDATEKTVPVTLALVGNMLSSEGVAQLRCRAVAGENTWYSSPITVQYREEADSVLTVVEKEKVNVAAGKAAAALPMQSANAGTMLLAEGDGSEFAEEVPEFVTVTIDYILYSYQPEDNTLVEKEMGEAFSSYVATLKSETDLDTTVHCPTIVGYEPVLVSVIEGGVKRDPNDGEFDAGEDNVHILQTNVTSNVVYRVEYHPVEVNYKVRYFFQNIYDDVYVEDASIHPTVDTKGTTGTNPNLAFVQAKIPGFTSLYYEPETIAADGSTVFHVYYERNYYLMEFDCDGGYGTDTIYVRYGTHISVPNPVKSGWSFAGWDLVWSENPDAPVTQGDGTADTLPTEMPCYNTAYKALWAQADTTYSVAYWIIDASGNRGFLGRRIAEGTSGNTASGGKDLGTKAEGGYAICGNEDHTHVDSCYSCTMTVHEHTKDDCFKGMTLVWNDPGSGGDAIRDLEGGEDPESGYIYVVYSGRSGQYWPKLYLEDSNGNGTYYVVNGTEGGDNEESFSGIIDGGPIKSKSGTFNGEPLTTTKYRPKTSCNTIQHIHNSSCLSCKKHAHDEDSCYQDTRYMEYVESIEITKDGETVTFATDKNVAIEGDGSTVVNVYYKYKTYTIRYVYARKSGNNYQIATLTRNGVLSGCDWTDVGRAETMLPTFNDPSGKETRSSFESDGATYYYISLVAKFGEDISVQWPSANIGSCGGYDWGSWAAAAGTGYRTKYGDEHANIVGPYPIMSEDMIVEDPIQLDDGTYLAQNMIAWWGKDQGIENHAYHNYFEMLPDEEEVAGEVYETYNGKRYKLEQTYTFTAAHNGSTRVDPVQFTGFTVANENKSDQGDSNNFGNNGECEICGETCKFCNKFYYDRTIHTLSYVNYNVFSTAPDSKSMQYGATLHDPGEPEYPTGIEPGAYEFKGWYTTAECYEGTEVNWGTKTMPDGDLTLYAKWAPVVHDVYFYYLYDDMVDHMNDPDAEPEKYTWETTKTDGTPVKYPIKVDHGAILGTTYAFTPERWEDTNGNGQRDDGEEEYTFVGWFYLDEDNKKRFAPDTMEIKKDMRLFAEWQSSIDTQYHVTYVLDADATIDGIFYPQGTRIAVPTTGHLTAGRTKTFTAKVGTDLYSQFQSASLFPTTNSHSILMDQEMTKNKFEFRYVVDDSVWYRVRYVDKITGTDLLDEKIAESTEAIVTEKFAPITGYIPESYYIRKVLASDGTDGSADNVNELNEIVFYYTPDVDHGLYVIEYFTENLDGTWYLEQSALGSDDLFEPDGVTPKKVTEKVDPNKFTGFSYSYSTVTSYSWSDEEQEYVAGEPTQESGTTVTGTLTQGGLEICVYYTRESYDYEIRFVEYGTSNILGYGHLDKDGEIVMNGNTQVFDADDAAKAKYGSAISYTAPDRIKKTEDGTTVEYLFYATAEKPQTQTHIIRASNDENVLTFYYTAREVKIVYEAVCLYDGATKFGAVTMNYETAATLKNISGANALEADGFRFVGWYSDAACTDKVPVTWLYDAATKEQSNTGTWLIPGSLNTAQDEVHYYALFEPVKEDLKIIKEGENLGTDTFLFQVTGRDVLGQTVDMIVSIQGDGSVTIMDLYCGGYTVTELTGWSWTYDCDSTVSHTVTLTTQDKDNEGNLLNPQISTYEVTFTNSPKEVDWLGGESAANENQFSINNP